MYSSDLRNGKDIYKVKITHPLGKAGSSSMDREVAYEGHELDIWHDETWRMGARPVKDEGSK